MERLQKLRGVIYLRFERLARGFLLEVFLLTIATQLQYYTAGFAVMSYEKNSFSNLASFFYFL